jgi:hypothetical protein
MEIDRMPNAPVAIADAALARIALLILQGKSTKVRAYLGTMLPRSTPCAAIRQALAEEFSQMAFIEEALPWLAEPTLGAAVAAPTGDLLDRLRAAGNAGIPKRDCSAAELEAHASLVCERDVPTGGRPLTVVRLREFDARFNPFAGVD